MRVPDNLVLQTNLLGTDQMVKNRVRAYRDAGVTTLHVYPQGASLAERLETLGRVAELTNAVGAEQPGPRLSNVVPPAGIEPAACGLGNRRSVLLSYGGPYLKSATLARNRGH